METPSDASIGALDPKRVKCPSDDREGDSPGSSRPQDGGYPDGPFMEPLHPTGPDTHIYLPMLSNPLSLCTLVRLTSQHPSPIIATVIEITDKLRPLGREEEVWLVQLCPGTAF